MQAYIITIPNNKISIEAANRCINTSVEYKNEFSIKTYDAVTPDTVQQELRKHKVDWKWPWEGAVTDLQTGLVKQSYPTAVKAKRVSCSLSHLNLWKECIRVRAPILILEHDAMFLRKLDYNDYIKDDKYSIIGINNPLGNTRRSSVFHQAIQKSRYPICDVPVIDEVYVPQGLAGNSAYIIKPDAANKLVKAVHKHGLWPNDAIMCRQLLPYTIGVTKQYYTDTQRIVSTTTR